MARRFRDRGMLHPRSDGLLSLFSTFLCALCVSVVRTSSSGEVGQDFGDEAADAVGLREVREAQMEMRDAERRTLLNLRDDLLRRADEPDAIVERVGFGEFLRLRLAIGDGDRVAAPRLLDAVEVP